MKNFTCPQCNKVYPANEVTLEATAIRDFSPNAYVSYRAYCTKHPGKSLGSGRLTMSMANATPLAIQLDDPFADPPIIPNGEVKNKDYE